MINCREKICSGALDHCTPGSPTLFHMDESLVISPDLVALERGEEELLLVEASSHQPLYIKAGRDYVKTLLQRAGQVRDLETLRQEFPQDAGLIDALLRHHILLSKDPETKNADTAAPSAAERTLGISLYLLLSNTCNLGCVYCLNGSKTYRIHRHLKMKEEVAFKSIESCLERLHPGGSLQVVFFGGEPLLNWPMVEKVIGYCEESLKPVHPEKRIKFHITSNLTLLPDRLPHVARKYGISILCDLDGQAEIHDRCRPFRDGRPSHGTISSHVRKLIQEGVDVSLRATLTRLNQHKMLDIARHHRELGARGCGLVPLNPVNSDEELIDGRLLPDADALTQGLEQVYLSGTWSSENLFPFSAYASKVVPGNRITLGCGAPYGNTPVVDARGNVYPCIYLVGMGRFHMGNVLEGGFPRKDVLEWMTKTLHVDHLEECRSCPWRYLCGGGCPVLRLTVMDNPALTPEIAEYCSRINCDYNKKILELLFWELAEEASTCRPLEPARESSVALDPYQTIHC